jgi:transposase-like protein
MMARYQAKAAELGIGASTVRRWVTLARDGPAGLTTSRPLEHAVCAKVAERT